MSIPVEIDALETATQQYGWAYLLTVNDASTPKIVATTPRWDGDVLLIDEGGGSARNAESRTTVTLAYPPTDAGGYTLIVDGDATVDRTDPSRVVIRFAPTGAVLHRPAPADVDGSATGCAHDCAPVD